MREGKLNLSTMGSRRPLASTEGNPWRLTNRQLQVLCHICADLPTSEIAFKMHISARTLQSHLIDIYQKVDVYDRAGLVLAVLRNAIARKICWPELRITETDDEN